MYVFMCKSDVRVRGRMKLWGQICMCLCVSVSDRACMYVQARVQQCLIKARGSSPSLIRRSDGALIKECC